MSAATLDPITRLLLLGGDLFDILSGASSGDDATEAITRAANEANEETERRYQEVLGLNTEARELTQEQLNETGARIAGRLPFLGTGFENAIGALDSGRRSAMRGVQDSQNQADAVAIQHSRRLGGAASTALPALLNSNRRAAVRAASDIDSQLARDKAGLRTQQTLAVADADRDLTNFMERRNLIETGLIGDRQNIISSRQDSVNLPLALSQIQQGVGGRSTTGSILNSLGNFGALGGFGGLLGGGGLTVPGFAGGQFGLGGLFDEKGLFGKDGFLGDTLVGSLFQGIPGIGPLLGGLVPGLGSLNLGKFTSNLFDDIGDFFGGIF